MLGSIWISPYFVTISNNDALCCSGLGFHSFCIQQSSLYVLEYCDYPINDPQCHFLCKQLNIGICLKMVHCAGEHELWCFSPYFCDSMKPAMLHFPNTGWSQFSLIQGLDNIALIKWCLLIHIYSNIPPGSHIEYHYMLSTCSVSVQQIPFFCWTTHI